MKRIIVLIIISGFFATHSHPFIFKDLLAFAQRNRQILQHLEKWRNQLNKMDESIRKFREYQREFDRYYNTFNRVYRRISHVSWSNFITTAQGVYRDAMIFTELPKTLEDFDYLQNTDFLKENILYEENEYYRTYVDGLIKRHQNMVQELVVLENQINSLRQMQQDRLLRFEDYEQINQALSSGTSGEASLTEQIGLQNQLILEQLRQQHELASMIRFMIEKQFEADRERVDEMIRLGLLNNDSTENINELVKMFGIGTGED